jgi:hypothetical protein
MMARLFMGGGNLPDAGRIHHQFPSPDVPPSAAARNRRSVPPRRHYDRIKTDSGEVSKASISFWCR